MLCFRCGSYNPDDGVNCSVCGQDLAEKAQQKAPAPRRPSTGAQQALIFAPGELIAGRYKILDLIGQGGVGAVYRAKDTEVDVDVALKGISPNLLQTDDEQKQFQKAIKAARKLQHANIVRIYDEGHHQTPNRRFFTMKLLEGLTLRKIIRLRHDKGQAFSPEELIPIFQQLGAALDYAHKVTFHGDLKPENVVVLPDLLKITDFGLVKGLPLKPFLGIAKSRSKGFPYIAPELRVEAQSIDGRCDTYSLGVIFAEMLTGLVFEGHFSRAFTAALEQLPTRIDGLIRRALAEHPDGRYAKSSEFAKEVEGALASLGGAALPPPVPSSSASLPPKAPALSTPPAPSTSSKKPPPPPLETNPSQSSAKIKPPPAPEDDPSLLEIGQSQVLLLESQLNQVQGRAPTPNDAVTAERPATAGLDSDAAARVAQRLMGLDGKNPDDTVDDPTLRGGDDVDTNPGGRPAARDRKPSPGLSGKPGLVSSGERPPRPEELIGSLYSNEGDAKLIPPPLPSDDDAVGRSHFPLPGDDDVPTSENKAIAGRAPVAQPSSSAPSAEARPARDPTTMPATSKKEPTTTPAQASSSSLDETSEMQVKKRQTSAVDALGLSSDDHSVSSSAPSSSSLSSMPSVPPVKSEAGVAIHDALTALKLHPRPDLVEDPDLREALTRTAGTGSGRDDRFDGKGELPPALPPHNLDDDDDDVPAETMTLGSHRDDFEIVPPPVVAAPLRPVTPPRRPRSSGPHPVVVAGGVAVVVLGVLLGVRQLTRDDGPTPPDDNATVTVRPDIKKPDPPPDAPAVVDAGVVAAVVDAGVQVAAVDPAKLEAERKAREEAERLEREAAAAKVAEMAAKTETPPTTTPPTTTSTTTPKEDPKPPKEDPPPPKEDPKADVALAAGNCPAGMVKIEAGSFTFGSSSSDPMRNFGEVDASTVEVKTYCIDYYEAPNSKSALPTTGVSWSAAKNACDRSGKRLCSEVEWERACKGPSSTKFPYGSTYDADTCNTEDADGKPRQLAAAVDFKKCRSGFKVFMQAGNAEEWVADSVGGQKVAKGGSADRPDFASRCSARRALSAKSSSATLGYRCCADPK
jgi:serine/threonine protein kinase/formylglycine-generating enzyme required for sulfatase activity